MPKRSLILKSKITATLLALVIGLPLYAAADLTADFGKRVEYVPLVRHMMSQVHCYDTGTDDCETKSHLGTNFTKEYTLGFLLDGSRRRMKHLGFEPLYLCKSRDDNGVMMVTAGTTEDDPKDTCRDANFRPKRAGYISPTNQIEAPWPLYRCTNPDTSDTLLTDNPAECTAQAYDPAQLLGYLYAGGPLPLR